LADADGRLAVRYSIWLGGWLVVGIGLVVVWHRTMRRYTAPRCARHASQPQRQRNVLESVALVTLYMLLTIMTFYIPMRQPFWHGFDDPASLMGGDSPVIGTIYQVDDAHNRPLSYITAKLAALMSRDTVEGYLWVVLLEHGLTGLMVYGLL